MGNTLGHLFRITTWGESHGPAVGAVVDGCPAQVPLTEQDIQCQLDRRRPGQSSISTSRKEPDKVMILSGVSSGMTLGTPVSLMVWNTDAQGQDYAAFQEALRPSHADYTYRAKYGLHSWQGGGRASARETVGRVAAGAVARQVLAQHGCIEILAYVKQVHTLQAHIDPLTVTLEQIESNAVRCPDASCASDMIRRIQQAQQDGDSLGGVIEAVARGTPCGWGEPVFDKLEADLAKAMLSLPASKGFTIGSGFEGTLMTGVQHNDLFDTQDGHMRTRTNHSGGIQGGISNGQPIVLSVAFKPTATVAQPQPTVDIHGNPVIFHGRGRHDPCVLPRAVPIVEAMLALVLTDHMLRQRGQQGGQRGTV